MIQQGPGLVIHCATKGDQAGQERFVLDVGEWLVIQHQCTRGWQVSVVQTQAAEELSGRLGLDFVLTEKDSWTVTSLFHLEGDFSGVSPDGDGLHLLPPVVVMVVVGRDTG